MLESFQNFLQNFFPSKKQKDVVRLLPIVDEINTHFEQYASLSEEELRGKTVEFRARLRERIGSMEDEIATLREQLTQDIGADERDKIHGQLEILEKDRKEKTQEFLDELLPEAFAAVKEACRRLVGTQADVTGHKLIWDMVPFDVQLMGGIVLHEGTISEMSTGEGKTLVATLPLYLNALTGRGAHLVTVNDYLARRDSEWMGTIYTYLGLTVGCIQQQMNTFERKKQYLCDITYGTNSEFGFDYLRDNMAGDDAEIVQRGHYFAIVDEVDSILIDEARTPLIISGPVQHDDQSKFQEIKPRIERLVNAQRAFVAKIVAEAEELLTKGKKDEAGTLLLRAFRGYPKNNRLMKLLGDGDNKKLLQDTELVYLRDQGAQMHVIDDELYYVIEEKNHQIFLTEKGREQIITAGEDVDMFVIPDMGTEMSEIENNETLTPEQVQIKKDELIARYSDRSERIHIVDQLLRAYSLYEKDVEYVVQDGKVLIVDEFTGRILQGRRYSEGLHQAIEAKEDVEVEKDTQTFATVTIQNYFRLYEKLAGMTGTAETESGEFYEIYKLDVVVIPTNKPAVRKDKEDVIYRTKREKYNAVLKEIEETHKVGRPVLVGTTSVEVSETISRMLKRGNIPHNVLNAKQHAREAEIIANAGLKNAVTIATNMAGRGTDIKLGPGVVELGGLHIIGTERHESRRIDRQLRGRAGRQGDPGSSLFFLALDDDLMRLFGGERIAGIMQRMKMPEGEPITHAMVTRSVERAQKKVEENNFAIRKRLLEYDNVMNKQREVIYGMRRHAISGERLKDQILDMAEDIVQATVHEYFPNAEAAAIVDETRRIFLADVQLKAEEMQSLGEEGVRERVMEAVYEFYKRKEERTGSQFMAVIERLAFMQMIDNKWREHLREMDDLREGINLRSYGQKDPLLEYKTEAFGIFIAMQEGLRKEIVDLVFKTFPAPEQPQQQQQRTPQLRGGRRPMRAPSASRLTYQHENAQGMGLHAPLPEQTTPDGQPIPQGQDGAAPIKREPIRAAEKIGRNDPCPCGSGKKYKNCHGKDA